MHKIVGVNISNCKGSTCHFLSSQKFSLRSSHFYFFCLLLGSSPSFCQYCDNISTSVTSPFSPSYFSNRFSASSSSSSSPSSSSTPSSPSSYYYYYHYYYNYYYYYSSSPSSPSSSSSSLSSSSYRSCQLGQFLREKKDRLTILDALNAHGDLLLLFGMVKGVILFFNFCVLLSLLISFYYFYYFYSFSLLLICLI